MLFRGVYQGVWSVVFATIPSCMDCLSISSSCFFPGCMVESELMRFLVDCENIIAGAFFTTYEAIKYTLTNAPTTCPHPEKNRLPFTHTLPQPIIHSIASSSAEMVACFMLTPAEVIKQNAQVVQSKEHLNKDKGHANKMKDNRNKDRVGRNATIQAISQFREKPWRLWSGYTALVGRNLPFTGLTYPIFESTRERLIECRRQRRAQAMHTNVSDAENTNPLVERAVFTGISAGMSGTIVSTITTPIDVVKTRMMLAASDGQQRDDDNRNEKEKKQKHRGSWAVGKEIYHKEGTRGLFRGGAVRAGWTAISLSLYLTMYEGMRFYLEDRRNGKDTKNHEHERGETGI